MERPFERPVPGMAVSARSDLPGILGLKHADIDVISNWRACRYRGCSGGAACIDAGARQQRDHAPKSYWLRVYDLYRCRVERQILRADWRRNTRPDALLCLQGPGAARFRDARGHVRFQPKIRHSRYALGRQSLGSSPASPSRRIPRNRCHRSVLHTGNPVKGKSGTAKSLA
jgi:hypothetical protein